MTLVQWLVLPLILHVVLTFVVGSLNLQARIAAVKRGETRLKDIALDSSAWPQSARKYGNNFDNQFQVPMLAYAGVAILLATGLADAVSASLMWVFIVGRLLHTVVHTGKNDIRRRLSTFLLSYFAVAALWLWLAFRLFVIG